MPARILKLVLRMCCKEHLTLDELVELNTFCFNCSKQELNYLSLIGNKLFQNNGK